MKPKLKATTKLKKNPNEVKEKLILHYLWAFENR